VEISRWDLARTVAALEAAHPYEQVAYDVYPVGQPSSRLGVGAVGSLPASETLAAFLDRVCGALQAEAVRFAGDPESSVGRVAVCGGSGGDLIGAARRAGADVYVTGDLSYHRFFDTMSESGDLRMALVDAGHYETEALTEALLVDRLSARFPQVSFQRFAGRTSPIRWHAPGRSL
jgi:putative NIF3 family GTP cyclohydrolase 1 type 2